MCQSSLAPLGHRYFKQEVSEDQTDQTMITNKFDKCGNVASLMSLQRVKSVCTKRDWEWSSRALQLGNHTRTQAVPQWTRTVVQLGRDICRTVDNGRRCSHMFVPCCDRALRVECLLYSFHHGWKDFALPVAVYFRTNPPPTQPSPAPHSGFC
jgi:hypothetical protein